MWPVRRCDIAITEGRFSHQGASEAVELHGALEVGSVERVLDARRIERPALLIRIATGPWSSGSAPPPRPPGQVGQVGFE